MNPTPTIEGRSVTYITMRMAQILRISCFKSLQNSNKGLKFHPVDSVVVTGAGTQRLFSVKHLLGEANIDYMNFLLLEDGYKFLDDRSITHNFRSLSNKFL